MLRFQLFSLLFFYGLSTVLAQSPTPATAQKYPILIVGATAHLGNGKVIENSAIAFENGKLSLVADATLIRIDRSKFSQIFDASGKHAYPGFIAPATTLGLVEVEAIRPTQDYAETGSLNPNARSIIAYNTDSEILPTVRSNGVLLAQITPQGGLLSGTSSVVQLEAWNWEDAALAIDNGLHLNWPAPQGPGGAEGAGPDAKKSDRYDKEVLSVNRLLEEAQAYAQQPNPMAKNPRLEAMRGLFSQKTTLYVHTDNAKCMQEAVLLAEQYKLRCVLVGASDAWLVTDFLKAHSVSVILGPTQRLPDRDGDDIDRPFKLAAELHAQGIPFAFSSTGSWKQRNLPFMAGQAVAFGLPKEAAVEALTYSTAKILQVQDRCGTLEPGKDATLFISEGDALDMRTCKVTAAFIQGRMVNLDNKHKQLSRRFEEKYRN
jgi:imidazolonepropionase-like amidohydrolase